MSSYQEKLIYPQQRLKSVSVGSDVVVFSSSETLNSISPHVEVSKQLHKHLGYDLLLHNENDIERMFHENDYKTIIFTYGTGREYTSTAVPAIMGMVERTGVRPKLIYMKNEYNLGENHILWALCRDEGFEYEMVTNNTIESESRCKKYWNEWHIVNIQNLVWNNNDIEWYLQEPELSLFKFNNYGLKEYGDFMYYGAWRNEREDYFKYWLDRDFRISTSRKNFPKFRRIIPDAYLFLPLRERKELIKFKYTLYMEDMISTKYFTHLSNRFYECLEFDVMMFFDAICENTINRDVYPIDDWFMVKTKADLKEKRLWAEKDMGNFLEKMRLQRVNRGKVEGERQKTFKQLREIIEW